MIEHKTITVTEGGIRLDAALLAAFPSATRAFVKEALASGDILVGTDPSNLHRAVKGMKLRGGEMIRIMRLLEAADNLVLPEKDDLTCVFEDEAILAFDKRAGQPVQPLSCRETGTLMNAVVARYPECRPLGDQPLMAGALHRIDADTSGLVLVARTQAAFENLRAQFAAQTVEKTYLALVEGSVAVGGTLENNLIHDPTLPFCRMIDEAVAKPPFPFGRAALCCGRGRDGTHPPFPFGRAALCRGCGRDGAHPPFPFGRAALCRGRGRDGARPSRGFATATDVRCVRDEGRGIRGGRALHAVTKFTPVALTTVENEERTLLEVTIFTGVTHQIRAQLALAGLHIINDRLYGAFAIEGQTGHCLHALAAKFKHPLSGDPVEIRTPYPIWARPETL